MELAFRQEFVSMLLGMIDALVGSISQLLDLFTKPRLFPLNRC